MTRAPATEKQHGLSSLYSPRNGSHKAFGDGCSGREGGPSGTQSAAEQRQLVEVAAGGGLARQPEPIFQDGGVDAAEVGRHLQVAVLQIEQLRRLADQPRLDAGAGQQYRPGGAVVGALRAVLLHPPPELAEA